MTNSRTPELMDGAEQHANQIQYINAVLLQRLCYSRVHSSTPAFERISCLFIMCVCFQRHLALPKDGVERQFVKIARSSYMARTVYNITLCYCYGRFKCRDSVD